jgi:hypothetical protein
LSVYVDSLMDWGWKYGKSCHLIADTTEELHTFALSIGMKKEWFMKSKNNMPHYDLTAKRRADAVSKGAIPIDKYQFVKMMQEHRSQKQSPTIKGESSYGNPQAD